MLLRSSIPSSIEVRQNIPPKIDTILADPTQISQVLINLSTNAAHGVNSFISKPVTFDGLLNVVRALNQYWIEVVQLPSQVEYA